MMAVYELILVVSTLFCSWSAGRIAIFLLKELGLKPKYAQLATILSMLAFLLIISVPAGLLIGALVLVISGIVTPGARSHFSIETLLPLLIAATLALVGLQESPGTWPTFVSVMAIEACAWAVFAASVMIARGTQIHTLHFNLGTTLAVLPLALVPVLYADAHDSLALDAGLVCAALVGGMRTVHRDMNAAAFVRLPVALIVGYGIMQAVHYGAWPIATASLLIWIFSMLIGARYARDYA